MTGQKRVMLKSDRHPNADTTVCAYTAEPDRSHGKEDCFTGY